LAELAGLFVGVIVAFKIVDKYKDRLNRREWSKVRRYIFEGILIDLTLIALGIYRLLPIPGISYKEFPADLKGYKEESNQLWNKLNERINIISELSEKLPVNGKEFTVEETSDGKWHVIDMPEKPGSYLCIDEEAINKIIDRTYKNIRPQLDEIKNIQIPRVMQSPTDTKIIIEALMAFEMSINNYYYSMQASRGDTIDHYFITKNLVALSGKASELYNIINQELEKP
jgi:hypothetical protein